MKKWFFALLTLCAAISATAGPISREQAQQRAEQFLLSLPGNDFQGTLPEAQRLSPVTNRAKLAPRRGFRVTNSDHELYYVFNRGQGLGFVIASGDDSTQPVLGYTDEGEFDFTQAPDGLKWWLEYYTAQLEELADNPIENSSASKAPIRRIPVHPRVETLCTTRWNQGSPYNDECPIYFNLGRSVTGCVATAMAQVLYYHRAKSVTETQADIPAYNLTSETYGTQTVPGIPAGSPIDWDNMLDTYNSSSTAKQKKAVAQLMHYCGVSVQMMYTNSSSGAYSSNVDDAFKNYFGYGNKVQYVAGSNYSDEAWDALLYAEVAASRPVYLSGSNNDGGHAFVCDGYDGNHCFHINWGWGGSSDGYFMLTKLNPSSQGTGGSDGGYSGWPEAVIGVEPENFATRSMPFSNAILKKVCLEHFDADADGNFTFGEAAAVTDLGDAFKGQNFTTFNELYNFTGLTKLSDDAFAGCTRLTSVKLPKNLKVIGARAFQGCTSLKAFVLPDGLTTIEEQAFDGCKAFTCTLPDDVRSIGAHAFRGCTAMSSIDLPIHCTTFGEGAFQNCTKLSSVTLRSYKPQSIQAADNLFEGIDLTDATLNVVQGNKAYLSATSPWKDFGNIYEMRDLSRGNYTTMAEGKQFYLYNVGTARYLTRGEAYGTQAVVAATDNPMRFEFRRKAAMGEGVYYLYSDDTGSDDNHVLFRTATDGRVGSGVRATFVDGGDTRINDKTSWWHLALVEGETNVYTLQVPSGVAGYKQAQYCGIQPDHASNVASPTYGLYSDVIYADYPENCQWMLVEYDEQATATYRAAQQLQNLLALAAKKRIEYSREKAAYDNLSSTPEELVAAQRRLRKKLGYIHFSSDEVREIVFAQSVDLDGDGEITPSEASKILSFETAFFQNPNLTSLPDLQYFTSLDRISGNAFKDCVNLTDVTLPASIINVYYRAFMNCPSLRAIDLPARVEYIGDDAFNGCTALAEVRLSAADPAAIELGADVFAGVDLSKATLYVPFGSTQLYREAAVWKDFGTIKETRSLGKAGFSALAENEDVYVYNVGYRRYIAAGEAYGTQAVCGTNGFLYQLRRSKSMPEGTYYLYNTAKTSSNILFRTASDSKVGEGVKACFVDGSVSASAYWKVAPVEGKENVYTFQVPENQATYTEGEYLGILTSHETNYTWFTTEGLYWDVPYDGNELNCQWAFISKSDIDSLQNFFDLTQQLAQLLVKADARNLDTQAEHAVYDDFDSTEPQVTEAIASLRSKLHYIDFANEAAKTICVNTWDDDEDNELTLEEAAAVTNLGATFRGATTITSLEELRYFTGLTSLPADAFRSCTKLFSIYLPAGISEIGSNAFTNTGALKYVAVLNPTQVVDLASTGMTARNITAFVPSNLVETYAQHDSWTRATVQEYTGVPVVSAVAASRQYGRSNPKLNFVLSGAPINGTPELSVDVETTTPVGEYPISITPGTITSPGLVCESAALTIEPATLTVAAKSYQRNVGEANPEFEVTYSGFRNREKAEDVLLQKAVVECDATPQSPAGEYEIRVSGAEAQNYIFEYVSGKLTVVAPVGVRDLTSPDATEPAYDLSGRPVSQPKAGLYITRGKKISIRK